jgi:hypothetical protein
MENLLYTGQWQGFFKYGPEYGTIVEGQEAEFRLFIEELKEGQFKGRVIDWDGVGAEGETSIVNGFIKGDMISFTKQYEQHYIIDPWGESDIEHGEPGHKVIYEGYFDKKTNSFIGEWEIIYDITHTTELTIQEIFSGTWRMHRNE